MVSLGRLDWDPVILSSSDLVTSNVTDQVASEHSTPISEVLDREKHLAFYFYIWLFISTWEIYFYMVLFFFNSKIFSWRKSQNAFKHADPRISYLIDPTCKENWVLRKPVIFKLVKMCDNLTNDTGMCSNGSLVYSVLLGLRITGINTDFSHKMWCFRLEWRTHQSNFLHPRGTLHCLRLSALFKQEQIYLCRQLFTSHAIKVYQ